MPYERADAMAKLIPDELGITQQKAYEKEPKIEELLNRDPLAKRIWEYALALEGVKSEMQELTRVGRFGPSSKWSFFGEKEHNYF